MAARDCDRAGELSTKPIEELSRYRPANGGGALPGQRWAGIPKAKLVSEILLAEFSCRSSVTNAATKR